MDYQPVDDIDRKLIDQLRIDGRRSFGEIGRYVGLSEASARQRYNRLVDLGIVRVIGMSDAQKVGDVEAHLSLRVRGVPLDTVAQNLAAHPEVSFVASALGAYDLSVDVRCRDNAHLSEFVHERLRKIRGVYSVETSAVLEVLKETYLWAGFRDPVTRYVPQKHTRPVAPAPEG